MTGIVVCSWILPAASIPSIFPIRLDVHADKIRRIFHCHHHGILPVRRSPGNPVTIIFQQFLAA